MATATSSGSCRDEFAWNELPFIEPVNLAATLAGGQAFRWRQDATGDWWGEVESSVFALRQLPDECSIFWQTFPRQGDLQAVSQYLGLDQNLDRLYAEWLIADPSLSPTLRSLRGLRILRQPVNECFFAFQCASCNTIIKIERSVRKLAARYGEPIRTGLADPPFDFYRFPSAQALCSAAETDLRTDLWGYRAPRLIHLARILSSQQPGWLESLDQLPYEAAWRELAALPGIGRKVADCICLFGLRKDEAVPVDTHIRRIAQNRYCPQHAHKSLTPSGYEAIAQSLRARFGTQAGWAQQYLFQADFRKAARNPPGPH